MSNIRLQTSDICTAFNEMLGEPGPIIGSKVPDEHYDDFDRVLRKAIEEHDFSKDRVPGQAFLIIPDAIPFVLAGDGPRTKDPNDYIPALHRENVGLYLKREKAGDTNFCAAVVYTLDAYCKDPDVDEAEAARLKSLGATHVLVAIIASSAPAAPLTPYRFVHNLAGGNREAQEWTADEIREKAKEIKDYHDNWCVVAG